VKEKQNLLTSARIQEQRLECLKTGCWGEYLDPNGRKWR